MILDNTMGVEIDTVSKLKYFRVFMSHEEEKLK